MLYHVSELLSFYKISSIPLCKYTTFCLSIHLLRNIGVVSNLTIMNNADRNFCVQFLPGCKFPVLMGFHLGVGLLGQKVCLTFLGIAKLFPKVTASFYLPAHRGREFQFLHTLTNARFRKIFVLAYEECVSIFSEFISKNRVRGHDNNLLQGRWEMVSFSQCWQLLKALATLQGRILGTGLLVACV